MLSDMAGPNLDPVRSEPRTTYVDPSQPGFMEDPYPALAGVRAAAPVHFHPVGGNWGVMRYDDVDRVLRDSTLSQSQRFAPDTPRYRMIRDAGGGAYIESPSFFGFDAPDHGPPRRMIVPPFTPAAIERLRLRAQSIVDRTLDAKRSGDVLLLVEELAFRLPYEVTCYLLGIEPSHDVSELREWTWKGLNLMDPFMTRDQYDEYTASALALNGHIREVVEHKRGHLGDDVMSMIITEAASGEIIGPEQVVRSVQTLYHAGMDTTVNQTSLSMLALMRNRSQWELLCGEPSLLENAIEELLRYDTTAQFMHRTTPVDYEVGGTTVPANSQIVTWIASGNRDEQRFGPTASQLDIRRQDARHHLSFGRGIHSCLGLWLARMELQVAIGTIARRFPRTRIADGELTWRSTSFIRGLAELPLQLIA